MMFETDWLYGLVGGLMIGSSAALYLFFNGQIAGISGILGSLIDQPTRALRSSKFAFLVGLIFGPAIFIRSIFDVTLTMTDQLPLIIIGGLLVGFGTRLGSGCTSGHGVCGISRLSLRSITATCCFMGVAALVVYLIRHAIGL